MFEFLVYGIGSKPSVRRSVTLCWTCSAQIEFPSTGRPERAHSCLKGTQQPPPPRPSWAVMSVCQCCLTWSHLTHTHRVCPVVSGHLIAQSEASAGLLSLSHPLKVTGWETRLGLWCCAGDLRPSDGIFIPSRTKILLRISSPTTASDPISIFWKERMWKWQKVAGGWSVCLCMCARHNRSNTVLFSSCPFNTYRLACFPSPCEANILEVCKKKAIKKCKLCVFSSSGWAEAMLVFGGGWRYGQHTITQL